MSITLKPIFIVTCLQIQEQMEDLCWLTFSEKKNPVLVGFFSRCCLTGGLTCFPFCPVRSPVLDQLWEEQPNWQAFANSASRGVSFNRNSPISKHQHDHKSSTLCVFLCHIFRFGRLVITWWLRSTLRWPSNTRSIPTWQTWPRCRMPTRPSSRHLWDAFCKCHLKVQIAIAISIAMFR